jgi:dTDP-glucose 4,6-dehydratase
MKLLVTGGAGFIGSNFIRYVLARESDVEIVNFDILTYAGNLENLKDVEEDPRYSFVRGDIAVEEDVREVLTDEIDGVINFAAESHVDRSIVDATAFVNTNLKGTFVLLQIAREVGVDRFIHISTDEVYGSLSDKESSWTEDSPLLPNSPYSASKAGSDMLARSYFRTYRFPVIITRASNNYGPYQFPEKLIPLMITNAMNDQPLPVYGSGRNVRDWLFVEDHCEGIYQVYKEGRPGEVYNIAGDEERDNLYLVKELLRLLGKSESLITFVDDRPGHDWRYSMKADKLRDELGWKPNRTLEAGLEETISWYTDNTGWWERIKEGQYLNYYDRMYGQRLKTGKQSSKL